MGLAGKKLLSLFVELKFSYHQDDAKISEKKKNYLMSGKSLGDFFVTPKRMSASMPFQELQPNLAFMY